jgi:hypothetical protein
MIVSTPLRVRASRRLCAMAFASRKSRMRAPLHRRTERSGPALPTRSPMRGCGEKLIRSPSPKGRRRPVYRPWTKFEHGCATPVPYRAGNCFGFTLAATSRRLARCQVKS